MEGERSEDLPWLQRAAGLIAPIQPCASSDFCFRPPVSRAAPQPEKLQKNNITKKKKLVEVRRSHDHALI